MQMLLGSWRSESARRTRAAGVCRWTTRSGQRLQPTRTLPAAKLTSKPSSNPATAEYLREPFPCIPRLRQRTGRQRRAREQPVLSGTRHALPLHLQFQPHCDSAAFEDRKPFRRRAVDHKAQGAVAWRTGRRRGHARRGRCWSSRRRSCRRQVINASHATQA
jgi:hypothetical protein